jgi:hypothetical protein
LLTDCQHCATFGGPSAALKPRLPLGFDGKAKAITETHDGVEDALTLAAAEARRELSYLCVRLSDDAAGQKAGNWPSSIASLLRIRPRDAKLDAQFSSATH